MKVTLVLTALLISGSAAASPDQVAASYEASIAPVNNNYGSPSTIWWVGSVIYATTKCSGYAALLEEAAYASVTTSVIRGLVGTSLPTSAQWKAALDAGTSYTNGSGTFRMVTRATISNVVRGDLFASDYTTSGATGHTFIIESAALSATDVSTTIPGEPTADRWLAFVHDSSEVPHGTTDSRYHADPGGVDDKGIGHGWVYLYADSTNGVIVGWTWNTTSSTIYQATDPNAANYRPLTVGAITGPGI